MAYAPYDSIRKFKRQESTRISICFHIGIRDLDRSSPLLPDGSIKISRQVELHRVILLNNYYIIYDQFRTNTLYISPGIKKYNDIIKMLKSSVVDNYSYIDTHNGSISFKLFPC